MSKITFDELNSSLLDSITNGIKSVNTKYSTMNGIKEFNCKDGYVDNIYMEGETLVNLSKIDIIDTFNSDNVIRVRFDKDYQNSFYNRVSGNTYTLFNYTDKVITFVGVDLNGQWLTKDMRVPPKTSISITLTSSESICGVDFNPNDGWSKNDMSIYKPTMFNLLEGDYTNKQIPYFEGLKSVGQGDKIEVLNYSEIERSLLTGNYVDGEYIESYGSGDTGAGAIKTYEDLCYIDEYITVPDNCSSIIISNVNANIVEYDKDKNPIIITRKNRITLKHTQNILFKETVFAILNPNTKFLRFSLRIDSKGNQELIKICNYNKKQINQTFRSLPNCAKDELVKIGNSYYKLQKCEELLINESVNVESVIVKTNTVVFKTTAHGVHDSGNSYVLSNMFSFEHSWGDIEHIHANNNIINITILKSRLSTQDVTGFKAWLKANPVAVVYELAEPKLIPLPNFNPMTFGDKTTFLLNSGVVQGECDFEVTNSLGSEIEVLKNKESTLEEGLINNLYEYQSHQITEDNGANIYLGRGYDLNEKRFQFAGNYTTESDWKNVPILGRFWHIQILGNGQFVVQIAYSYAHNDVCMYTRRMDNFDSWRPWQKIATTSTLELVENQMDSHLNSINKLKDDNIQLKEEIKELQTFKTNMINMLLSTNLINKKDLLLIDQDIK
ncbi:MAG: pyocin knob domain-containing protein [Paraclostridium sp.]